ncbi:MAG: hypothetical protein J6T98_00625 [Salinivirgaceae bacterium]|nr:hypothetical protein [Salinivirgaceae bacterium]
MNIIRISVLAIVLLVAGVGCSTDEDAAKYEYVDGLLVDMSKFSGCGWIIDYDGYTLEPFNIDDFGMDMADSVTVRFAYEIHSNQNSECMMGTVVRLIDIYRK